MTIRRSLLASLASLASLACAGRATAMDPGDSKVQFVDVRVQGGFDQGVRSVDGESARPRESPIAAITVMCGDIGSARQAEEDWAENLGIVIGARFFAAHWVGADGDARPTINAYGIEAVGGLGLLFAKELHVELCAAYGIAAASDRSPSHLDFHQTGDVRRYGGEIGTYYTWPSQWQAGFVLGYQRAQIKAENGSSHRVAWHAGGIDAEVAVGYRF